MNRFWAFSLIMPIMMWYVLFGVLDRNYDVALKDVENTIYTYNMIASKKGILNKSILDEMTKKLSKYGPYDMYITAEKYDGGATPTKLEGYAVVNTDLRAQGYDLLTINVMYKRPHAVSALYKVTVFMTPQASANELYLFGTSTMYIR